MTKERTHLNIRKKVIQKITVNPRYYAKVKKGRERKDENMGSFEINKALGTHIRITGVNGKFETPKDSPTPWLYELYCPKCGKVITKYKSLCKSVRTAKNYYHNSCRVSLKARKIKK